MLENSAAAPGAAVYDLTTLGSDARLRLLGRVSFAVDAGANAIFLGLLEQTSALIQLRIDLDDGDRPVLHLWRAGGIDEPALLVVDLLTALVIDRSDASNQSSD